VVFEQKNKQTKKDGVETFVLLPHVGGESLLSGDRENDAFFDLIIIVSNDGISINIMFRTFSGNVLVKSYIGLSSIKEG
jgi:hypothetical protein